MDLSHHIACSVHPPALSKFLSFIFLFCRGCYCCCGGGGGGGGCRACNIYFLVVLTRASSRYHGSMAQQMFLPFLLSLPLFHTQFLLLTFLNDPLLLNAFEIPVYTFRQKRSECTHLDGEAVK